MRGGVRRRWERLMGTFRRQCTRTCMIAWRLDVSVVCGLFERNEGLSAKVRTTTYHWVIETERKLFGHDHA
jgi:hypothetical protein